MNIRIYDSSVVKEDKIRYSVKKRMIVNIFSVKRPITFLPLDDSDESQSLYYPVLDRTKSSTQTKTIKINRQTESLEFYRSCYI